jgi:Kef-type K+ transport system membrane component KefB
VIGAAVIDDVIGLIILSAVIGIASSGSFSLINTLYITGLAVVFLGGALIIGNIAAAPLLKYIHQMKAGGVLFVFAFAFCLIMAFFSQVVGLAPIVGAFAAGLILSRTESQEHIESQVKPVADIFVPIFFVMMGATVNLGIFNLLDPINQAILLLVLTLFAAAVLGKLLSGFPVFEKINKYVIGIGMVPRGEVGLIFAAYGLSHQIINQQLYSAIITVIALTTFITPPLLKQLIRKS